MKIHGLHVISDAILFRFKGQLAIAGSQVGTRTTLHDHSPYIYTSLYMYGIVKVVSSKIEHETVKSIELPES